MIASSHKVCYATLEAFEATPIDTPRERADPCLTRTIFSKSGSLVFFWQKSGSLTQERI